MSKVRTGRELLVLSYCETRDPALRDGILIEYKWLVDYIARKFAYNRSDTEDLMQVGSIGLLNSLDRFDPSKDVDFSTFATPNIIGEIKHFFRDKNRIIKIPRKIQELGGKVRSYVRECQGDGRSPTVSEIALALDETEEHVLESMEVSQVALVVSLDSPAYRSGSYEDGNSTLLDNLGVASTSDAVLIKETLDQALTKLPQREQDVIHLRFFCGLSQVEIGQRLNLSQMHISRLLTKSLHHLKKLLSEYV